MTPPFDAVHHVCIVVPDIDAAIAFYEKVGIGGWQDFHAALVNRIRPRPEPDV